MNVTGEQVKKSCLDAGITVIAHHPCSLCGEWVCYRVQGEDLFFDSSCGCASSEPQPCPWGRAANWINMQSDDRIAQDIAAKFGIKREKQPA